MELEGMINEIRKYYKPMDKEELLDFIRYSFDGYNLKLIELTDIPIKLALELKNEGHIMIGRCATCDAFIPPCEIYCEEDKEGEDVEEVCTVNLFLVDKDNKSTFYPYDGCDEEQGEMLNEALSIWKENN